MATPGVQAGMLGREDTNAGPERPDHSCGETSRWLADFVAAPMERLFLAAAAVLCACGDPSPSPAANQSLFTAGGAIGLAFEALDRDWRVEFEGRGRNNLVSNRTSTFASAGSPETYLFTTTAKNVWSTMVNLWRDYELSDRWTMYVGAGIGAGGYRFSYQKLSPADNYQVYTATNVSAFAWQAGGGTAYALTDRITLDIGYRFFQIANGSSTAVVSYVPGPPVGSEVVGAAFSASELFFAFRIYEPFRNWR